MRRVALVEPPRVQAGNHRRGDHHQRHAGIEFPVQFLPAGVLGWILGLDQRPGKHQGDRKAGRENDDERRQGAAPAEGRQHAARELNQEPRHHRIRHHYAVEMVLLQACEEAGLGIGGVRHGLSPGKGLLA